MIGEALERVRCTCKVTGPGYDQTKFDPKCPFHGRDGTMVAVIDLTKVVGARVDPSASGA